MSKILINQDPKIHRPIPLDDQYEQWLKIISAYEAKTYILEIEHINSTDMHSLNTRFRARPTPTNVLSFPSVADDHKVEGALVFCPEIIHNEALELDNDWLEHWAHLFVHGCLHLNGYTHAQENDAIEMEKREISILYKLNIPNPYGDSYA